MSCGVLCCFMWSWVSGAQGCEGCRVSLLLAQSSPLPAPGGDRAAKTFSSITSTSMLAVTREKLTCCPGWVPGCGEQRARGWAAPLPPSLAAQ